MTEVKTNNLIKATDLYEEARRRHDELSKMKIALEKELAGAPEGKIHIVKTNKRVQFYLREEKTDKSGKYISKKETGKISKYVQKTYDEKTLRMINDELQGLEILLRRSDAIANSIRNSYSDNPPEVKRMIDPIDVSDEDYKKEWQETAYIGKPVAEHVPYFETRRKERVRSKSELTIANMLDRYGVPYKYECPVILKNGKQVYPDFTVLKVRERKVFYWEHRGMMDDRDYVRQAVLKAKELRRIGIVLGDNLIITEETSTAPLGTDEIESVIVQLLL